MNQALLRQIPKMDLLLAHPLLAPLAEKTSRSAVKAAIQERLNLLRRGILDGSLEAIPDTEALCRDILAGADTACHLRPVINATGVVLHTNLGRAPLSIAAAENLSRIARGYCNLEYDLEAGKRGSRYDHVEELICRLTGAEAAMVVNNNAGAVFLMLNTLAKDRHVAISRGEPPISTSSPREMATCSPRARVLSMRNTAPALLLTTMAASAPVRRQMSSSTWS